MTKETKNAQSIPPSEAILAVIASFLITLFLAAGFAIFVGEGPSMVIGELLIAAVPFGYLLSKKVDVKKYIGLEINFKTILLGIAIGVLLFFFDVIVINLLVSIFGPSEAIEESNKLIAEMAKSGEGLFWITVALILAGICEEFTFRGFLQTAINSKYSLPTALFVSSLAFGLTHFDPKALYTFSAFLMGLVLGYVYHRWRSCTVSAIAHTTINLITLALIILTL